MSESSEVVGGGTLVAAPPPPKVSTAPVEEGGGGTLLEDANRIYKCMSYGKTPMNFFQRTKKQVKKTDRRTRHESIEKHTSLQRDGVEMRNGPQGMTRNSS